MIAAMSVREPAIWTPSEDFDPNQRGDIIRLRNAFGAYLYAQNLKEFAEEYHMRWEAMEEIQATRENHRNGGSLLPYQAASYLCSHGNTNKKVPSPRASFQPFAITRRAATTKENFTRQQTEIVLTSTATHHSSRRKPCGSAIATLTKQRKAKPNLTMSPRPHHPGFQSWPPRCTSTPRGWGHPSICWSPTW